MGKRAKRMIIALSVVLLLVFLLCIPPLLANPRVFRIDKGIDVNSGDLRVQVYICGLQTKNVVETTRFSREVRRLGISIPEGRVWQTVSTESLTGGTCILYWFRKTIRQCNELMELFDGGNVPDEERRVILQKILTVLQSEKGRELREIDAELDALAEKCTKHRHRIVYRGRFGVTSQHVKSRDIYEQAFVKPALRLGPSCLSKGRSRGFSGEFQTSGASRPRADIRHHPASGRRPITIFVCRSKAVRYNERCLKPGFGTLQDGGYYEGYMGVCVSHIGKYLRRVVGG